MLTPPRGRGPAASQLAVYRWEYGSFACGGSGVRDHQGPGFLRHLVDKAGLELLALYPQPPPEMTEMDLTYGSHISLVFVF